MNVRRSHSETVTRGRIPRWVPFFNSIARPLLALGVPMGPDILITVRGRKTGLPRTTPVTICENAGRRGVISPLAKPTGPATSVRQAEQPSRSDGGRKRSPQLSWLRLKPSNSFAMCLPHWRGAQGLVGGSFGMSTRSISTTLRQLLSVDRSSSSFL